MPTPGLELAANNDAFHISLMTDGISEDIHGLGVSALPGIDVWVGVQSGNLYGLLLHPATRLVPNEVRRAGKHPIPKITSKQDALSLYLFDSGAHVTKRTVGVNVGKLELAVHYAKSGKVVGLTVFEARAALSEGVYQHLGADQL